MSQPGPLVVGKAIFTFNTIWGNFSLSMFPMPAIPRIPPPAPPWIQAGRVRPNKHHLGSHPRVFVRPPRFISRM